MIILAEVAARIQFVVAQKLEHAPVELVRPGAQLQVHVRTRVSAVFGRVVAALNLELRQCVDRWIQVDVVRPVVHDGDAVDVHLLPRIPRYR
jgi:hypothetical protein